MHKEHAASIRDQLWAGGCEIVFVERRVARYLYQAEYFFKKLIVTSSRINARICIGGVAMVENSKINLLGWGLIVLGGYLGPYVSLYIIRISMSADIVTIQEYNTNFLRSAFYYLPIILSFVAGALGKDPFQGFAIALLTSGLFSYFMGLL